MADFSRLPGPNADLWDWQLVAACRGVDSSLFFHPEGERGAARSAREAAAKEVCMRCPVRAECATHALAVREPYGVWGGLTEDEREAMMGRSRSRSTDRHEDHDVSEGSGSSGGRHGSRTRTTADRYGDDYGDDDHERTGRGARDPYDGYDDYDERDMAEDEAEEVHPMDAMGPSGGHDWDTEPVRSY
jgi:hypothetical protein